MDNITQTELYDNRTLTTISIGNMTKKQGESIKEKLDGQTWMNFEIQVCPIGGSWAISAITTAAATQEEIMGMFIYLMATKIY